MIQIKNKVDCCGCHSCYNICPTQAIKMQADEYGFKYPIVDQNKCINCGLCEKVCPIINKITRDNKPEAYAIINKDEDVRKKSSSGGVFTLIAERIIEKGGVVFGASFDEKFIVKHIKVENNDGLQKLRGSKYVQCDINKTYTEAKEILETGRTVLFTGTPCQINGLYSFLNKNYDNLYTQDIICHGVPSPKVWKNYLGYRNKIDKQVPIKINFRQKDNGWKEFAMSFKYAKKTYLKDHGEDLYMKAFLSNLSLRDSCYECNFKDKKRISDITLGDFWGINNILPDMNDNRGISLVIINSEKGKELLENISNKIIKKQVDFEESIKYNSAMIHSVPLNKNREKFLRKIDSKNFSILCFKYIRIPNLNKKISNKIKIFRKSEK